MNVAIFAFQLSSEMIHRPNIKDNFIIKTRNCGIKLIVFNLSYADCYNYCHLLCRFTLSTLHVSNMFIYSMFSIYDYFMANLDIQILLGLVVLSLVNYRAKSTCN